MGKDREWLFDLTLTILASPFIFLEKLARFSARAVMAAVRNRRTSLDRVNAETEMMKALAEREKAAALLREQERQNRPEGTKAEVVVEPSSEDADSLSEELRARKKAELEATYARVKQDEERLADESMPEEERREWENFYAQKRREIREEIREYV